MRKQRDAIELLGQEVIAVTGGKYPSSFPDPGRRGVWIDGPELSRECLRYMYRLLFLFYAEANPLRGRPRVYRDLPEGSTIITDRRVPRRRKAG